MKEKDKKDIKILVIEIIVGIMIAGVGLVILLQNLNSDADSNLDYYTSMCFAFGVGLAFSAGTQILRKIYWNSPKHKEEYEIRTQNAHINSVDERLRDIRARAAYVTYQVMFFSLIVLDFILALLHVDAWIILMVVFILAFQVITWMLAFRKLEKKM